MSNPVKTKLQTRATAATDRAKSAKATTLKTAAESATEKAQVVALATAKKIQAQSIPEQIAAVQINVGSMLADLTNKLTNTVTDFTSLEAAVATVRAELEELYGIRRESETLAALIKENEEFKSAHETEKADLDAQLEQARSEMEDMIRQAEANAQAAHETLAEKLRVQRDRATENWTWEFEQGKKKAIAERDDLLASKLKSYNATVDELNAKIKEREKAVAEREAVVTSREQKMADLEAQVSAIPQVVTEARAEADEAARKDERRSAAIEINSIKREKDTHVGIASAKIEHLSEQIAAERVKVSELQRKLDDAYTRVQEMAIKMAEGSKTQFVTVGGGNQANTAPSGR